MKLLFKQRLLSWLDSYDIYGEKGETIFTVKGKFGWGHKLHIHDHEGNHIATLQEDLWTPFFSSYTMYEGTRQAGTIQKKFSLFKPRFEIDCNGWNIEGNLFELDYNIVNMFGENVAVISKDIFNFTDTYSIDIKDDKNALYVLMVVLAIDADKCTRRKWL